jgi:signal transduction histidine kinase
MSKKRPSHHGRARSLALSAWPLRFKVALAIAIPLLLAATLGGLQVRSDLKAAANSSSSAKQVTVLRPAVDYLTAAERAMVAAHGASVESLAQLRVAVADVQAAAEQLTEVRGSADLTTEQRYQLDALVDLSRAVRDANTEPLSTGAWIAQLRQLQSGVTQLITSIVNAQLDPEPRLELLSQALAGRFSLSMQEALASTDRTGETGSLELFAELGVEGAAIDRLASALGEEEPAIAALRTENAQRSHDVRTGGGTGGSNLDADNAYAQYDGLAETLLGGIDRQLATSASDARRSALVNGGLTLAALVAAILLAFLISRLLLNPIRKVREGARTVASKQLPEAIARIRAGDDPGPIRPIDVTTHEEVGQLARAVDELHRQAVILASGEADLRSQVSEMFITLSRRNTSLVNQQLGLIEALEKDEEDPRRLESLFRLDHLASRMRRTADSLLVLAEAPTHTTAADDLTVSTSLQAATAGVRDYQRVHVGTASTARISETAAADVVHLLTELVDNALAYSAPTTTVVLSSTTGPNGVTVEVRDAGLGIPEQALADINETLRSGGDVTPDTARRMGLFVVSRLARRHGISVSLQQNDHNGTTALVLLPASILDFGAPAKPAASPVRAVEPVTPLSTGSIATNGEPPTLEERLDAAMGLPRRRPGTSETPSSIPLPLRPVPALDSPAAGDAPAASVHSAAAEPVAALPVSRVDPPPEPRPDSWAWPSADVPAPKGREPEPSSPSAEPMATPTVASTPSSPPTAASFVAATDAAPPAAALGSAGLEGPAFPPLLDSEAETETPIFKALRSAWLSANPLGETWRSSEIEAGWARAGSVADAPPEEVPVTPTGLPMRRPGTRLVPGGVAKPAAVGTRDPEAIRARLAAHASGVSRGRAASHASDQQPPEESPS